MNQQTENQSSSGIIVSTGLGSTGWMKSILAGAAGIFGKNSTNGNSDEKNFQGHPLDIVNYLP